MKRFDIRLLLGIVLIFGSLLGFLELQGILANASALFWAVTLGAAALVFLFIFFRHRNHWWAAIPGFTLAGLSAANFFSGSLGWPALVSLGGISLGFWAVYFSGRHRWWAIIPAGTLLTLGVTSLLSETVGLMNSATPFFMGMGLTFLLVALLAKMTWVTIPAAVLFILGLLADTQGEATYRLAWIAILLFAGVIMIFQALRKK